MRSAAAELVGPLARLRSFSFPATSEVASSSRSARAVVRSSARILRGQREPDRRVSREGWLDFRWRSWQRRGSGRDGRSARLRLDRTQLWAQLGRKRRAGPDNVLCHSPGVQRRRDGARDLASHAASLSRRDRPRWLSPNRRERSRTTASCDWSRSSLCSGDAVASALGRRSVGAVTAAAVRVDPVGPQQIEPFGRHRQAHGVLGRGADARGEPDIPAVVDWRWCLRLHPGIDTLAGKRLLDR